MTAASPIYSALGLSRNPFPPTPDAGSYFFTPRLEEDFSEIVHCIEARKGFVLLTGEVGLGKSTLVRRLLDTLQDRSCHSALILNTFLQDNDLLSAIQADFGLPATASVDQGLACLTAFLIDRHRAGEISLLVIDDAQNLSVASLELVRLLCNLETEQEKLLQILLVGQPELEQTLAKSELRQLESRIVKHARLNGLQKSELIRYFDFRVNAAGAEGRLSIEPDAADALHRATSGNLRRIHLVLDRCLYGLSSARASVVTAALVRRAVDDLPALSGDAPSTASSVRAPRRKAWVVAGLLAGATATVALANFSLGEVPSPGASTAKTTERAWAVSDRSPETPATPPLVASKAASAADLVTPPSRNACESRLKAVETTGDVMHVQQLADGMADTFETSPRVCRFAVGQEAWVAWLGRGEPQQIDLAQQATRKVQIALKRMGLLDAREPNDGFFGSKTGEALARFQQQNGLPATGRPDELTFLFLEHQDVSPR